MFIIKLVSAFVSLLPSRALDHIEKEVFRGPDFIKGFDPQDDSVYDIGLVFGGLPERALAAFDLYTSGKIKKILLSGGIGVATKKISKDAEPEAATYLRYATAYGIPLSDILVEDTSTNTEENVKNSLELLRTKRYDLDRITILAITSDFHVKRCIEIMKRYLRIDQMSWIGVKSDYSKNWRHTTNGRFYIFKEYLKTSYSTPFHQNTL